MGAGAPWPGTLVPPKGGPSPVSQDRALPSLLEETLRCWQVENKSVSNHKTSPKPVRNPKCRSGLEEDGGPCWGHHQSRGSRRAVGVPHGGVVTHGGGLTHAQCPGRAQEGREIGKGESVAGLVPRVALSSSRFGTPGGTGRTCPLVPTSLSLGRCSPERDLNPTGLTE